MARRPAGLIYWVDEKPPAFELAVLAVQHIFLMSSTLVLPVVLIREIGGSFDQVRAVVVAPGSAIKLGPEGTAAGPSWAGACMSGRGSA